MNLPNIQVSGAEFWKEFKIRKKNLSVQFFYIFVILCAAAPDAPEKPKIVDADRDFIDIEWNAPKDGGSPITGYIVERLDKSKPNADWAPVTRQPIKVRVRVTAVYI